MGRALLLACLVAAAAPNEPPHPPIDPEAIHALANDAVAAADGDGDVALAALDRKVAERWGDVLVEPLTISDAPTEIRLFSPYAAYRKSIVELLRRKQSIDPLPFTPLAVVIVAPARIDAPDVTAISVRRGRQSIEAAVNTLSVRDVTSAMGVTARLHAGFVAFPLDAFAPGAEVIVSADVEGGAPLTLTLDQATLSRFR